MKDPRHIMPAIDLLQAYKKKTSLPWWLIPLDYLLAGVYLVTFCGVIAFGIYKLWSWL
jgi:hypothetical protein